MSTIKQLLKNMAKTLSKQITATVTDVALHHGVTDVDAFVRDVLAGIGLADTTVKTDGSVTSEKRKRVVSKKMKDTYLGMEGANEENLKTTMEAYKAADEVESFEAFARERLGLQKTEEPKKEKKTEKPKKEKGRLNWTPTSTKLFKTITEELGGTMNDDTKKEFVTYVEGLTDEVFAAAAMQGHMRSFVTTKYKVEKEEPKAEEPKVEKPKKEEETKVEKPKKEKAEKPKKEKEPKPKKEKEEPKAEKKAEKKEEEEDEMTETTFEGETLWVEAKSGKVYREVDGVDTLVGQVGKGRFKDMTI